MTPIALLVALIFLFILFFKVQGWFIRNLAHYLTGQIVWFIVRLVVAIVTGYVIYISIVLIGMAGRIRSISDVFAILLARPSQIGGSGLVGVWIGLLFAFFSFFCWSPSSS